MKKSLQNIVWIGILIALISCGQQSIAEPLIASEARMAILQFSDYTSNRVSSEIIEPLLYSELDRLGSVLISTDSLRNILRSYRIRAVGQISQKGINLLNDGDNIDYLLLGSFNVLDTSQNPEAWISMRLLDIKTGSICWSNSVFATGDDHAGLLGTGLITDIGTLVGELITKSFDDLKKANSISKSSMNYKDNAKFAVISFDNISEDDRAGDIISSEFVNEMILSGIEVVEPGIVSAALRDNGKAFRGEIDIESAQFLHEKFGIEYIITGTLDRFSPRSPGSATSIPKLGFGARLIEASTGRFIAAVELSRDGIDSEIVFDLGTHKSIGSLAHSMVTKCLKKLRNDMERYVQDK